MKTHEVVGKDAEYIDIFDLVIAIEESQSQEVAELPPSIKVSLVAFMSAVESVRTGETNTIELISSNVHHIENSVEDIVYTLNDAMGDIEDYLDETLADLQATFLHMIYYLWYRGMA